MSLARSVPVALALLLAPTLQAQAQACLGMPLGRAPTAVAGEAALNPDFTVLRVRLAREIGASASGGLEIARAKHSADRGSEGIGGPESAYSVGGNFAVNLGSLLPLCSFAEVHHARSSHSAEFWGSDVGSSHYESGYRATSGGVGLGTAMQARLSRAAVVIPYGNTRVGWVQSQHEFGCSDSPGCAMTAYSEGQAYVAGEAGAILRVSGVFAGGGVRLVTSGSDPLLQSIARWSDGARLLTLTVGMMF